VFLRELISNAADACEKLRYEMLSHPELGSGELPRITVTLDPTSGGSSSRTMASA
jgi:molecular chaperone HtpG